MNDLTVDVQGGVATVTLDRPPVNAVTLALYARIGELSPNSARPQTLTARSSPEVVPGRSVRGWTSTNSSHRRSRTIPTGPR